MKQTPFHQFHLALGAKMAEFAGYDMPIRYGNIVDEHHAVRQGVGVFDVSHMGEFIVKGAGAADLIQRVTSNDVSKLTPGKAQYSCLPNDRGGIVDDLLVYHLEDGNYMLVVNASNIQKDWDWIQAHNHNNVEMVDISDRTALLAVQGPLAAEVVAQLTDVDVAGLKYYTFAKGELAGVKNVIISATGYTGSGGFELYLDQSGAAEVWQALFAAGEKQGIRPIGLGARDTLRLEMGFCLYGNDIWDETSPIEAGLGWITKFPEGVDYPSREIFAQQKADGVEKKLMGFVMKEKGIPRQGYDIADANGQIIGKVTSGTQSPTLGQAIGLAYINSAMAKPGNEIMLMVRNKAIPAELMRPPFVTV